MANRQAKPSFKTDVHRAQTKRWAEAKQADYGGDDWGGYDDYDDDYYEPAQPSKATGLRQKGQASSASQEHQSHQQYPAPSHRRSSFEAGDDYQLDNGPMKAASPPPAAAQRQQSNPVGGAGSQMGSDPKVSQRFPSPGAGQSDNAHREPSPQIATAIRINTQAPSSQSPPSSSSKTSFTRDPQSTPRHALASPMDGAMPQSPYQQRPGQSMGSRASPPPNGQRAQPFYPPGAQPRRQESRERMAQSPSHPHMPPKRPSQEDFHQNYGRWGSGSGAQTSAEHSRQDYPSAQPPYGRMPGRVPSNEAMTQGSGMIGVRPPPRKDSLSTGQQQAPPSNYQQSGHPAFRGSSAGEGGDSRPGSGAGGGQGSDAQPASPSFIRPSDIYKRIEAERVKQRSSSESKRPSNEPRNPNLDTADQKKRTAESRVAPQPPTIVQPTAEKSATGAQKQEQGATGRSKGRLDPVTERRSEYGMDGLPLRDPSFSRDPALDGQVTPLLGNFPSKVTADPPMLPQLDRFSTFGASFLTASQDTSEPVPPLPNAAVEKQSQMLASAKSAQQPDIQEPGNLEHQPSRGFRTAVNQAFDGEQRGNLSPDGQHSVNRSNSDMSRSNTDSTAGISPIISRLPSDAVPMSIDKEIARGTAADATATSHGTGEGAQSGSRPTSGATLQALQSPSDSVHSAHSREGSGQGTPNASTVPPFRRDFHAPSTAETPARTPAISNRKPLDSGAEPELETANSFNSRESSGREPLSENTADGAENLPEPKNELEDVTPSTSLDDSAKVSASGIALNEDNKRSAQAKSASEARSASPTKSRTGDPRPTSPGKGRVRDLASKYNGLREVPSTSPTGSISSWASSTKASPVVGDNSKDTFGEESIPIMLGAASVSSGPSKPSVPGQWHSNTTSATTSKEPSGEDAAGQETNVKSDNDASGLANEVTSLDSPAMNHGSSFVAHSDDNSSMKDVKHNSLQVDTSGHPSDTPASSGIKVSPATLLGSDIVAEASPQEASDQFPETAPLSIKPPATRFEAREFSATSQGSSNLSLDPTSDDTETDLLRKDIAQSLSSPRSPAAVANSVGPASSSFLGGNLSPPSPSASPDLRQSSHIPHEYDSYWNRTPSFASGEGGFAAKKSETQTQHAPDTTASPTGESAERQAPTATLPSVTVPTDRASRPPMLDNRFSWEGTEPSSSAKGNQSRANPDVSPNDAREREDEAQEHREDPSVDFANTSLDYDPSAYEARRSSRGSSQMEYEDAEDRPSGDAQRYSAQSSLQKRASDDLPKDTDSFVSPTAIPSIDTSGISVDKSRSRASTANAMSPNNPISPNSAVSPQTGFRAPSSGQRMSQMKLPGFKEIQSIKHTPQRLETYKTTQQQFASLETGLGDWLAFMAKEYPEANAPTTGPVRPVVSTVGLAGTVRRKIDPLAAKLSRSGTVLETESSPGYSKTADGASGSRRQEVLRSAGAFGGKASQSAKGLFAKGRSRFRGASTEKTSIFSSTNRSANRWKLPSLKSPYEPDSISNSLFHYQTIAGSNNNNVPGVQENSSAVVGAHRYLDQSRNTTLERQGASHPPTEQKSAVSNTAQAGSLPWTSTDSSFTPTYTQIAETKFRSGVEPSTSRSRGQEWSARSADEAKAARPITIAGPAPTRLEHRKEDESGLKYPEGQPREKRSSADGNFGPGRIPMRSLTSSRLRDALPRGLLSDSVLADATEKSENDPDDARGHSVQGSESSEFTPFNPAHGSPHPARPSDPLFSNGTESTRLRAHSYAQNITTSLSRPRYSLDGSIQSSVLHRNGGINEPLDSRPRLPSLETSVAAHDGPVETSPDSASQYSPINTTQRYPSISKTALPRFPAITEPPPKRQKQSKDSLKPSGVSSAHDIDRSRSDVSSVSIETNLQDHTLGDVRNQSQIMPDRRMSVSSDEDLVDMGDMDGRGTSRNVTMKEFLMASPRAEPQSNVSTSVPELGPFMQEPLETPTNGQSKRRRSSSIPNLLNKANSAWNTFSSPQSPKESTGQMNALNASSSLGDPATKADGKRKNTPLALLRMSKTNEPKRRHSFGINLSLGDMLKPSANISSTKIDDSNSGSRAHASSALDVAMSPTMSAESSHNNRNRTLLGLRRLSRSGLLGSDDGAQSFDAYQTPTSPVDRDGTTVQPGSAGGKSSKRASFLNSLLHRTKLHPEEHHTEMTRVGTVQSAGSPQVFHPGENQGIQSTLPSDMIQAGPPLRHPGHRSDSYTTSHTNARNMVHIQPPAMSHEEAQQDITSPARGRLHEINFDAVPPRLPPKTSSPARSARVASLQQQALQRSLSDHDLAQTPSSPSSPPPSYLNQTSSGSAISMPHVIAHQPPRYTPTPVPQRKSSRTPPVNSGGFGTEFPGRPPVEALPLVSMDESESDRVPRSFEGASREGSAHVGSSAARPETERRESPQTGENPDDEILMSPTSYPGQEWMPSVYA